VLARQAQLPTKAFVNRFDVFELGKKIKRQKGENGKKV